MLLFFKKGELAFLVEGVGVHPEHAVGAAFVDVAGFGVFAGGAHGDEEGEEVFFGGVFVGGVRGFGAVGQEVAAAAFGDGGVHPGGEGFGFGVLRGVDGLAAEAAEVVGPGAGADDEDAFVAERGEGFAELVVVGGAEVALDGNLQDRDVGVGVGEDEGAPGAVVEAAAMVHRAVQAGGGEEVGDVFGEGGVTGGGVGELVEGGGEAAEVVDGVVAGDGVDLGGGGFPVGGGDEDGFGAGQAVAEAAQEILRRGFGEGQHRGAVGDEEAREHGG